MAKTYSHLWPQVVSWDNLVRAYQKCRRGKRYESLAAQFDFDWESQLLRLQKELITNAYFPGDDLLAILRPKGLPIRRLRWLWANGEIAPKKVAKAWSVGLTTQTEQILSVSERRSGSVFALRDDEE